MPVDKNIVDSMLNPFRAMVQEVEQKNLSGTAVDAMKEMLGIRKRKIRRNVREVKGFPENFLQNGGAVISA
jgi:hypothetical protein